MTAEEMIYPWGFSFAPEGNCWPARIFYFLVVYILELDFELCLDTYHSNSYEHQS